MKLLPTFLTESVAYIFDNIMLTLHPQNVRGRNFKKFHRLFVKLWISKDCPKCENLYIFQYWEILMNWYFKWQFFYLDDLRVISTITKIKVQVLRFFGLQIRFILIGVQFVLICCVPVFPRLYYSSTFGSKNLKAHLGPNFMKVVN